MESWAHWLSYSLRWCIGFLTGRRRILVVFYTGCTLAEDITAYVVIDQVDYKFPGKNKDTRWPELIRKMDGKCRGCRKQLRDKVKKEKENKAED